VPNRRITMWKLFSCIYLITGIITVWADNPCNLRETENGTICVCDSTYCDTVPKIADLTSGQYQLYTTSQANLGFYSTLGNFSNTSEIAVGWVTVADLSRTHQSIIGFGGAFTDATGINIARLSTEAQDLLLQSYFGDDGIQYSLGRVPIGGTDFSTRAYTYVDEIDETLEGFALQEEDIKFKIPYIQRAIELRGGKPFKLFGSAWSAPIWMKTNNWYNGVGTVKDEYWGLWAEYYLKFFDAYKENGLSFWGVTTQNEPSNGITGMAVQNVGFTSEQMIIWVTQFLGPAIRNSTSYKDIKILLHDDQRSQLITLKNEVLSDDGVIQYADGVAVHWYTDASTPAEFLDFIQSDKKDLFRLATEACAGFMAIVDLDIPVNLGSWDRAEQYMESIIDDLNYDVTGWTDWNMALNETGGPNWIWNEVDSPIIVNGDSDEFYKQPMFYALGHFSKFLVPDSVRVDVEVAGEGISSVAFIRPDGKLAVILRNKSDVDVAIKVNILGSREILTITQHSINTLLYAL